MVVWSIVRLVLMVPPRDVRSSRHVWIAGLLLHLRGTVDACLFHHLLIKVIYMGINQVRLTAVLFKLRVTVPIILHY